MKQKTTMVLIILGFLIFVSLFICVRPSFEGLNTMKKNTHVLERGEYMDDVGYLKSEDGNYKLKFQNGMLKCKRKENSKWKHHWTMDTSGSKIMLLSDYGILQIKTSKDAKYIPVTETKDAQSLLLTAYGTLELKSETNGKGDTLWSYPLTEGLDTADKEVVQLMDNLEEDRTKLAKRVLHNMNKLRLSDKPGVGTITDDEKLENGWNNWFTNDKMDGTDFSDTNELSTNIGVLGSVYNLNSITTDADKIPNGDHDTILKNDLKLKRLRNNLDNKVKVLNEIGESHVTEKQMRLDSTIYIGIAWTVVASSLVYYTLTQ